MVTLPVTGLEVELRSPNGFDDLVIAASGGELRHAVGAAARLASPPPGRPPLDWAVLPLTDFDVLFLQLRRALFGDTVKAESRCPEPACARPIDASFGIAAYLDYHCPEVPADLRPAAEAGWWRLDGVEFRAPTVGDLMATAVAGGSAQVLAERCLRESGYSAAARRRAEAALAQVAPSLSDDLQATCPECGREIALRFDPPAYVLAELRNQAASVALEVHLLASAYHWSEEAILGLPSRRRRVYADLIRDEGRDG